MPFLLQIWLSSLLGIQLLLRLDVVALWLFVFVFIAFLKAFRCMAIVMVISCLYFFIRFELVQTYAFRPALVGPQKLRICGLEQSQFGSSAEIMDSKKFKGRKFYFNERLADGECVDREISFKALSSQEITAFPGIELKRELQGPVARIKSNLKSYYNRESNQLSSLEQLKEAVIFGKGHSLSDEIWTAARRTGLAHLFVASGLHIGLLFFIIQLFVRPLRVLSVWVKQLIPIAGVWIYVQYFELGLPAQRAALAISLFYVISQIFPWFRRYKAIELCAISGCIFILWQPLWAASATYVLSFGVCASLLLIKEHFYKLIGGSIAGSLIACYLAFTGSAFSFAFNLLVAPVFSLFIFPILLISSVTKKIASLASFPVDAFVIALKYLEGIAYGLPQMQLSASQSLVLWVSFIFALNFRHLNLKLFVIPWLLCFGMSLLVPLQKIFPNSYLEVVDVGQGDGHILRLGQATILIDGGKSHRFINELRARDIRTVDLWILSHFDEDHSGVFENFSRDLEVKEVWVPGLDSSAVSRRIWEDFGRHARTPPQKMHRVFGSFELKAERVTKNIRGRIRNKDSLVVELWAKKRLLGLFLGDLPAAQERAWLREHKSYPQVPLEFIKIAHHGSASSTSSELLRKFRPKLALISVGRGNFYRFPKPSVLDRLERDGATIIRTDTRGSFKLKF